MRALLIGSGYAGLPVDASVSAMFTWLCGHGFDATEVRRISGDAATRDAMLANLDHLAEVDPGDAPVVFYYAGHGQLYRTQLGVEDEGHAAYPLLVAMDLNASGDGTLRSVLGSELSRALQRVARRARNLTVILDCCHASGMIRLDDDLDGPIVHAHERLLQAEASARIARHRAPLLRSVGEIAPPERLSERVIVITASSAGGRTYPHPVTERLVFTDALLAALTEYETWDTVLADVRARVQAVWPIQHPAVFGPRFRQPFTLDEHLPAGELFRVEQHDAHTVLFAGNLKGIHPNDEFELLTYATTSPGPTAIVGSVRPYVIQPERTVLQAPGAIRVPRPCYARRTRRGDPPAAAITSDEPTRTAELSQIARNGGFRIGASDVAAHIELRAGTVHIRDCLGELVYAATVEQITPDDLCRCLRRLDSWRGVSRWLRGESSGQPLKGCYSLSWGLLGGTPTGLTTGPVTVRPGEALALGLHNLDRGAPDLFMQAFRVGADREIRGWNAETGAQHAAARQRIDGGELHASGRHAAVVASPPNLLPGLYCEWTLVVVSNLSFDVDPLETPVNARTLATGFSHARGPTRRSVGVDRFIDTVAFPYTIDLRQDPLIE